MVKNIRLKLLEFQLAIFKRMRVTRKISGSLFLRLSQTLSLESCARYLLEGVIDVNDRSRSLLFPFSSRASSVDAPQLYYN